MADNATMRDRGQFWSPVPDWTKAALTGDGWTARRLEGVGQTLVSGDIETAVGVLAHGAAEVGLWGLVDTGRVIVHIARGKALIVTPSPLGVEPTWRAGFVATPADDAWAVFEIAGPQLVGLVTQATAADLDAGSRSAALLFAGTPALLYRTAPHTARLHIEAPLATYLWNWLEGAR